MFNLTQYERSPWSLLEELESLQSDMNRTFSRWPLAGAYGRVQRTYPAVNVWASNDGIVVDAEMPGVEPKDVDLAVQGDELTIKVHVNERTPAEGETYHRHERMTGEFTRTLRLPYNADAAAVKANYNNGLLRIAIPRAESDKPKKIAVEAA